MSIQRFKRTEELTVPELLEFNRTGTRPETNEYREAVAKALDDAGLEHDGSSAPDLEDMSVDDHFNQIRRTR